MTYICIGIFYDTQETIFETVELPQPLDLNDLAQVQFIYQRAANQRLAGLRESDPDYDCYGDSMEFVWVAVIHATFAQLSGHWVDAVTTERLADELAQLERNPAWLPVSSTFWKQS